jgi:two-component system NtrC family sensor kinase
MARQQSLEEIAEPLEVNETINNTLTLVKSHVQQGNVDLSVVLGESLPPVMAVRGQLEDVWLNLLLNARDAVANCPNPLIGITTAHNGDQYRFEVTVWDNGKGIPEALQKKIFEPFFTTKPSGEGTGLGLHICRQVVEAFHGSLSVQSAYNEGTRFLIYLPVDHGREPNP